jgi:Protein of unknown function (DUF4060)
MKTKITGDREPWHIVAAHKAIESHRAIYYYSRKAVIYTITYRGKKAAVEVINRKCSVSATVLAGHRELWANAVYLG